MSGVPALEILAGAAAVGLAVAAAAAVVVYNGFVRLAYACDRAWSNIDVLLKQRYDEIPNLVAVCRGYMEYEREVLARVTEARSAGLAALERAQEGAGVARGAVTARGRVDADGAAALAAAALGDLFALAEAYPDLRANAQFLRLQTRITALESEIADRREHFNDCITNYNVRLEQFPDLAIARILGLRRRPLLRIAASERRVPRVTPQLTAAAR
jgi:LemA protein